MGNTTHSAGKRLILMAAGLAAFLGMAPARLSAGAVFGPAEGETTFSLPLQETGEIGGKELATAWGRITPDGEQSKALRRMPQGTPITVSRRRNYGV